MLIEPPNRMSSKLGKHAAGLIIESRLKHIARADLQSAHLRVTALAKSGVACVMQNLMSRAFCSRIKKKSLQLGLCGKCCRIVVSLCLVHAMKLFSPFKLKVVIMCHCDCNSLRD